MYCMKNFFDRNKNFIAEPLRKIAMYAIIVYVVLIDNKCACSSAG